MIVQENREKELKPTVETTDYGATFVSVETTAADSPSVEEPVEEKYRDDAALSDEVKETEVQEEVKVQEEAPVPTPKPRKKRTPKK